MRVFSCPSCRAVVFFLNRFCGACGAELVWDPVTHAFLANLEPCRNRAEIGCNWAAASPNGGLCRSCAMTTVIPDTFHGDNRRLWAEAEDAKRRVLAAIGRWGWFNPGDTGLLPQFQLLSEETRYGEREVVMAHHSGVITINVTEANLVERVERGAALGDKLRTMVGHFRHELAHFLFERLRSRNGFVEAFRAVLGDERVDYATTLAAYHEKGPPAGWSGNFITAYAASHPHEDWAETVTHLLHLTDIIDSAVAVQWRSPRLNDMDYDAYSETDPRRLVELGSYFSMATNHINRSIGLRDVYPFVLTPQVRDKLAFVHGWVRSPW